MASSGYDWPYLLSIALGKLHLTEDQFWAMTPRKFIALANSILEVELLIAGRLDPKDTRQQAANNKPVGEREQAYLKAHGATGFVDELNGW